MPIFTSRDRTLNAALGSLAQAMFPSGTPELDAAYRGAQINNLRAKAEQDRMKTQLLEETAQRSRELAPYMSEQLVQTQLGDRPGISDTIAGPPTPATQAQEGFLRALPAALLSREGDINQFADAINTAQGGMGVAFGPRDQLGRNALLQAGGSRDLGKTEEAAAADPTDPTTAAGFGLALEGTGMEQQMTSRALQLTHKLRTTGRLSGPEQLALNQARAWLQQPKVDRVRVFDEEGNAYWQNVQRPGRDLSYLDTPLAPAPSVGQPAAPVTLSGETTPDGQPVPPVGAVLREGEVQLQPGEATPEREQAEIQRIAAGQVLPRQPSPAPTGRLRASAPVGQESLKEAEAKNLGFFRRMDFGNQILATADVPGIVDFYLATPKEGTMATLATNAMASESAQSFMQGAQSFLSAILRKDTGAAAPLHEYPQYWVQFIPMPGNSPDILAQKARAREVAMDSISEGLPSRLALERAQQAVGAVTPPENMQQMLSESISRMTPARVQEMNQDEITNTLQSMQAAGVRPPEEAMRALAARMNQLGM